MDLKNILLNLPEVKRPIEKKLAFDVKLKWTLAMLISFFILAEIPLYGMSNNALEQFKYLAVILGTKFGSVISLGIGPIVMASIILQLLVGSKLLNLDLTTPDGKRYFQGLQKMLAIFFCLFEASVYVLMKGLEALPGLEWLLITQLIIGGILIIFMDEVVSKYGFGSGVSLFIAAGVSLELFTRLFSPFNEAGALALFGKGQVVGKLWVLINSVATANTIEATAALGTIIATIVIVLIVVYVQSIKVEVPLSFGRIRGFGMRWPLNFFYTSNIPVILVSALFANVQVLARLAEKWVGHPTFLGTFSAQGAPQAGLAVFLHAPNLVDSILRGYFVPSFLGRAIIYILFMIIGCIIFSVFWVKTSGTDAASQARNILSSGLQIPGFRRDPRVLESILSRYITPLAVMGGAAIGLLAAAADLMGALAGGTSILLGVMIVYHLYQQIAQQHAYDMYPSLKKFIK